MNSEVAATGAQRRSLVIVTGMHRCGTSAFAGSLEKIGLELPRKQLVANEFNQKGYFEPSDIVDLNDAFLGQQGLAWDTCNPPDFSRARTLDTMAQRIIEAIEANYSSDRPYVVKDPRIARLHGLWRRVVDLAGWEAKYVLMYRDPALVAASLKRRDGWPGERAIWLWLAHISGSARVSEGHQRVWVDATRFVRDASTTLHNVVAEIGEGWPIEQNRISEALGDFVERDLMHGAALSRPSWAEETSDAFRALQRLSLDSEDQPALATIEAIGAFVDRCGDAVEQALNAGDGYWKQFVETSANLTDAETALAKREALLSELEAKLRRQHEESREREASYLHRIEGLHSEVDRLTEDAKVRLEGIGQLQSEVDTAKATVDRLETLIAQKDADFDRLKHAAMWLAKKAASAERHPITTLIRRTGSGLTKGIASLPGLKSTSVGRGFQKLNDKGSPKRFKRRLADALPQGNDIVPEYANGSSLTWPDAGNAYIPLSQLRAPKDHRARVIAFYLPQYHPIEENDRWWGKGFTEWTYVSRAKPQFDGHYQPHLPGELGFYDLRVSDVQRRQAELAKQYGIDAFCYYFYWFAGHTLLEHPLRAMLNDPSIDMPFCLCWANENWTRRWDGQERDVLIAQSHSREDDLAFISYISDYLRDPRYIRVGGRPMLVVYRPNLLDDMAETAETWRTWCRENGIGEIYLCMTQSFESTDPAKYGLDASIEFPPNNIPLRDITTAVQPRDPDYNGRVYDWTLFLKYARSYEIPSFPVHRGTCVSWDNTPRRGPNGTYFHGATPDAFSEWLSLAIKDEAHRYVDPSERLVFVNAWNEWGEGAHLEPDQHYGYAWLDAVRRAHLATRDVEQEGPFAEPVCIVVHDAHRHGAQFLALHLAKFYAQTLNAPVHVVLLGPGALQEDFEKLATVYSLAGHDPGGQEAGLVAHRLHRAGVRRAIVNSVASGGFVEQLDRAGIESVALVHEMPVLIKDYGLEDAARLISQYASDIVFPANIVANGFNGVAEVEAQKSKIQPQGLYHDRAPWDEKVRAGRRKIARDRLGIPADALVVLGMGFGDHRKGIDLFVEAGVQICKENDKAHFVWAGVLHVPIEPEIRATVANANLQDRIRFLGFVDDPEDILLASDVFLLSSREDPFPSVVLMAMDSRLPVVAIEGTGGAADLLAEGYGVLAAAPETDQVASALKSVLDDPAKRSDLGARGHDLVADRFSFRRYAIDLATRWGKRAPRISVIVPNYNYVRYLPGRLSSVIYQSWPIYELIILDDASTDDSARWLQEQMQSLFPEARLIVNDDNSGSVFKQWYRGITEANGDLIWIAEADDLATPTFLESLANAFEDPEVVLAYCQSRAIDTDGNLLGENYHHYTDDISRKKWLTSYVEDAGDALASDFAVKNVIPNVSATLVRRDRLLRAMEGLVDDLPNWKVAGDWRVYVELLSEGGKIAYIPASLNSHRRHSVSVTSSLVAQQHFDEVVRMQQLVAERAKVSGEVARIAADYLTRVKKDLSLE